MGNKRAEIMSKCPDDFEDDLKEFIDSIEGEVNTAAEHMKISSLDELNRIDEAHDMLVNLAEDLY